VHFDLKPANIFLKGDIARVGDFGLSKLVTESRNSLSFGRGTPYYMAPEMLQRRGDARSDIYSLGIILYECLCGDVPFKGDSEWEVLRKHETQPPHFPDHLGSDDRRILARCLAKDPAARYQGVAELLRELNAPVALGESLLLPRRGAAAPAPKAAPALAPLRPALGDPADVRVRDTADSPYGLPWSKGEPQGSGLLAFVVRQVFRVFELCIFVILLPVRLISSVSGHGALWLLRLPFRVLGFAAQLVGYAVVAALVLLVVMAILAVFQAA
jgi:hypothetical protein